MGNTASSTHDTTQNNTTPPPLMKHCNSIVDGGMCIPFGIYTTKDDDLNMEAVQNLIVERKLAPFYRGLAEEVIEEKEYAEKDEEKVQIFYGKDEKPVHKEKEEKKKEEKFDVKTWIVGEWKKFRKKQDIFHQHEEEKPECQDFQQEQLFLQTLYQDSIECPICLLYYPSNINYSTCCHQPICTECFIQMKPNHNGNEPDCPFCVHPDFHIHYQPYIPSIETADKEKELEQNDLNKIKIGVLDLRPGYIEKFNERRQREMELERQRQLLFLQQQQMNEMFHMQRQQRRQQRRLEREGYFQPIAMLNDAQNEIESLMVREAIRLSILEEEERQKKHQLEQPEEDSIDDAVQETSHQAQNNEQQPDAD